MVRDLMQKRHHQGVHAGALLNSGTPTFLQVQQVRGFMSNVGTGDTGFAWLGHQWRLEPPQRPRARVYGGEGKEKVILYFYFKNSFTYI